MYIIVYIMLILIYPFDKGGCIVILKNRVRELRARDRLSQQDLADRIDVSRQTIALIERGDYSPSIVIALKMAQLFRVSVEELFMLEGHINE